MKRFAVLLVAIAALSAAEPALAGQLVYTRDQKIWTMRDDGSAQRPLIRQADPKIFYSLDQPAVARDGTVFFDGSNTRFNTFYNDPSNAAIGVHNGFGAQGIYEWDGGAARRLSVPQSFCFNCTTTDQDAAPATDGTVFFQFRICIGAVGGGSQPFRCNTNLRTLTRGTAPDRDFGQACDTDSSDDPKGPVPNPRNPRQIAYVGCRVTSDQDTVERLWVSGPGRSGERALGIVNTDFDDPDLDWRPDGKEIVVRGSDGSSFGLYAYPVAGGAPRKVLDEPNGIVFDSPTYIGAGRIAFGVRTSDDNPDVRDPQDIYTVPAGCNGCAFPAAAKRLTTDRKSSAPDWTPLRTFSPVQGASARGRGRTVALRISLVRRARLTITVRRGSTRLGTVTRRLAPGRRSLRITRVRGKRLRPGRYRLAVKAPGFPALTAAARIR